MTIIQEGIYSDSDSKRNKNISNLHTDYISSFAPFVNNIKFMSIIWATGAFLVSLTYLLLHTDLIFYDIIFWIGILLSGMSTYAMVSSGNKTYIKLFFLFLFGFVLYIPHLLSSPNYFHIYDELIHYQTTTLMYETGNVDISASFVISKYYPTLEILTVFFKSITGDTIFKSGLIIIGIAHSFTVVFLYLFFRNICSEKIASLGAFAYLFNSSYTHFDTYFSYESIGLPLLVLCLFAVSRGVNRYDKNRYNNINEYNNGYNDGIEIILVQIILIMGLVITHHFSSYVLLLFMTALLIINVINHETDYRKIRSLTILTGTLIFAWVLYIASIVLTYYNGIFKNAVEGVLKLSLFEERISELLLGQFLDVPFYELFIRRLIYTPLILILVFIGIYYLFKNKKLGTANGHVLALTIFCGIFFISLLGSLTASFEIGRFSTYGFIGIAFFIGVSIERLQKNNLTRVIIGISVMLLLIGGISVGISSPYRGSYSDHIRIGQQTITTDTIYSAEWSEKYMGRRNGMIADIATGAAFKYYGFQNAKTDYAWEVFFPSNVSSGVTSHLASRQIDYIAVDKRITRFISELRYYFSREELYIKDHPVYGRTEPLPEDSIKKFDNNIIFSKMYDNGNINVYKVLK